MHIFNTSFTLFRDAFLHLPTSLWWSKVSGKAPSDELPALSARSSCSTSASSSTCWSVWDLGFEESGFIAPSACCYTDSVQGSGFRGSAVKLATSSYLYAGQGESFGNRGNLKQIMQGMRIVKGMRIMKVMM